MIRERHDQHWGCRKSGDANEIIASSLDEALQETLGRGGFQFLPASGRSSSESFVHAAAAVDQEDDFRAFAQTLNLAANTKRPSGARMTAASAATPQIFRPIVIQYDKGSMGAASIDGALDARSGERKSGANAKGVNARTSG